MKLRTPALSKVRRLASANTKRNTPIESAALSVVEALEHRAMFAAAPNGYYLLNTVTVNTFNNGANTTDPPAVVSSTDVLKSGVNYKFIASGDFILGGGGGQTYKGDAEYGNFDSWNGKKYDNNPGAQTTDYGIAFHSHVSGGGNLSKADGQKWGAYQDSHQYTIDVRGSGTTEDFQYSDDHYPSNSGTLTVEIFAPLEKDKKDPCPTGGGGNPVRYNDGSMKLAETSLSSDGFGFPIDIGYTLTNDVAGAQQGLMGPGVAVTSLPRLLQGASAAQVKIVNGTISMLYFDKVGSNWVAEDDSNDKLTYDTGTDTFTYQKPDGTQEQFYGLGSGTDPKLQGQFKQATTPGGQVTGVTYDSTSHNVLSIQRTDGSKQERFLYSYVAATDSVPERRGLLASVQQDQSADSGSTWQAVRHVDYAYYGYESTALETGYTINDGSLAGRLQTVTVRNGTGSGSVIDGQHVRYWKKQLLALGAITSSGTTATIALPGHDYAVGDSIIVSGADQAGYDGTFTVTAVTGTTLSYTLAASIASPATGTLYVQNAKAGVGLVKEFVAADAYDRMTGAGLTPETATDAQVRTYATNYFEYDASGRVTKEAVQGMGCSACSGGVGTYAFAYTDRPGASGYNSWAEKTVETLGDGNQNIVYTNSYAQVILKSFKNNTTGQEWTNFYRYDASGHQILKASPSAVTGYSESYDDLVNYNVGTGSATYLSTSNGLIETDVYAATTTAVTGGASGDVAGYFKSSSIQNGTGGTAVAQSAMTYYAVTGGGSTIYPVATETQYRATGGGGSQTTTYAYTFFTGTTQMQTRTVTHPVITTAQNGSNAALSDVTYFDNAGRAIWVIDGGGFLTYNTYDPATGAMTQQTKDVNTSLIAPASVAVSGLTSSGTTATLTTSAPNAFAAGQTVKVAGATPSAYNGTFIIASIISNTQFTYVTATAPGSAATGTITAQVATPAGGGLNLTTTMVVDNKGRTTKLTDPNGNLTYTLYDDANHSTRVYRGWNATTGLPTGPTEVTRNDRLHSYSETLTMSAAPTVTGSAGSYVPTGTEAIGGLQSLSRDIVNNSGQVIYRDVYTTAGLTYATTQTIGTAGTDYLRTEYGYDWRGRQARMKSPDGTWTHTVFDGLGRVVSVYKGTNNTGWTQTDPTGGGATGNNMVQVSGNVYDGGGVGDSNLTASTQYSGLASYTTNYAYDFRDRMTGLRGPDGVASAYTMDNLGEQTETDTYVDGNANFTIDPGEQVGKSTVAYDELGRPYQSTTYQNSRALTAGALVSSGTTATVTLANHGFANGQSVTIAGATQTAYDGTFTITVTGANTFTLTLATSTTSPATGSRITVTADKRLTTNTWYDPRGNMAKALNPNGLINKWFYDSADRLVRTDTDADPTEVSPGTYADALSLTNDQVIEQNDYWLDKGGRTRIATNWKRDGKQVSSTTGVPTADVYDHSTVAYWYDTADRLTATADYGRDGAEAGAASTDAMVWNQTGYSYKDSNSDGNPQHGIPNNGIPDVLDATSPGWDNFSNAATDYVYRWITTTYGYDAGGRQSSVTDNAERVQQTLYDLAGRTTSVVNNYNGSAVTAGTAGDTDQTTQYVYDNFGRLSQQIALNPKGSSIEQQKTTYLYGSDVDRSWVTATLYPDSADTTSVDSTGKGTVSTGTDHTSTTYDRLGRQATATDQRGVVHTFTYDSAGRFSTDSIGTAALPTGVDGTVRSIAYTYDDQSRIATVTSYDGTTPTPVALNQVAYTYDAWGNVTRDAEEHGGTSSGGLVTSTTPAVNYLYTDGSGTTTTAKSVHLSKVLYPANNGTTIGTFAYGYETTDIGAALDRISTISDGSSNILVQYYWIGIAQRINQTFHPQVSGGLEMNDGTQSGDYSGLDRYYRFAKMQWQTNSGSTNFEQRFGKYDRMGSLLRTDSSPASGAGDTNFDQAYTYDGLERLTSYNRGNLNGFKTIASPNLTQTWTLDALGNWAAFSQTNNSTSINGTALTTFTQTRSANAANEITGTSGTSGTGGTFASATYDNAGNQNAGPKGDTPTSQIGYVYDGWNRLVGVDATNNGSLADAGDVKYSYDGTGRRITKLLVAAVATSNTTEEYYQNEVDQVLEVRVGTFTTGVKQINVNPKERYLWDLSYVDAPAMIELDTNTDGTRDNRLWATWDISHNVSSLLTDQGKVVEHYVYTPYGQRTILNGASNYAGTGADADGAEWTPDTVGGTADNRSDFGMLLGFQGLREDTESGTSVADKRQLNHIEGWTQRDHRGYVNSANLYEPLISNPIKNVDPTGDAIIPFDFMKAGDNHFNPLYLGGSNAQPVGFLSDAEHLAFHQSFEDNGLGYMHGNGDVARDAWSRMGTAEKVDQIIKAAGPDGANLSGEKLDTLIDKMPDILDGENPGVKTVRGTKGASLWDAADTAEVIKDIDTIGESGPLIGETLSARLAPIEAGLGLAFLLERLTLGVAGDAKQNGTCYWEQLKAELQKDIDAINDLLNSGPGGPGPRGPA